jgi:hypothetical protein
MAVHWKDSGVGPIGYWPVDCLEAQLAEEDPGSMAEIPGALDPDQGMVHETNCCLSILKSMNHFVRICMLCFEIFLKKMQCFMHFQ